MTANRKSADNTKTEQATSSTRSSTTTATTAHGPGRITAQDFEAIRTSYLDILGPLNAAKARDIEIAIENGLDASAILDALDCTAMAARPTHYYLRAILRRYATDRIFTAEDAERDRMRFRAERDQARQETWGTWYRNPEDECWW